MEPKNNHVKLMHVWDFNARYWQVTFQGDRDSSEVCFARCGVSLYAHIHMCVIFVLRAWGQGDTVTGCSFYSFSGFHLLALSMSAGENAEWYIFSKWQVSELTVSTLCLTENKQSKALFCHLLSVLIVWLHTGSQNTFEMLLRDASP